MNKKRVMFICISLVIVAVITFFVIRTVYRLEYYYSGIWVDPNDLPGTYVGYYDTRGRMVTVNTEKGIYRGGYHRLDLHRDGTYVYVYTNVNGIYTNINGIEIQRSGDWEYFKFDGGFFGYRKLVLHNFIFAPEKQDETGGFWPERAQKVEGRLAFSVNSDDGFYFIKVE